MKVSEAVRLIDGVIKSEIADDKAINGAFLDSRLVTDGALFFAVKGEQDDGNLYAAKALNNNAAAVILSDEKVYDNLKGNKILVKDTLVSLKQFGAMRLKKAKGIKIAVTGSFGKTSTKDMLVQIFSCYAKTYGTHGNKNNELGLSLTGAGIDDDAKYIILEMGSNAPGEISALSKMAEPDAAVVVSAGYAHVGKFGGFKNIIKEKLSIANGLKKNGVMIIPEYLKECLTEDNFRTITFGEPLVSDFYVTETRREGLKTFFEINKGGPGYFINHPYEHLVYNSLSAIAAAYMENIPISKIIKGLSLFEMSHGHGSIEKAGDVVVINDAYNAGFDSVVASAASLHGVNISPKYAVFGELGEIEGYEDMLYGKIADMSNTYPDIKFYLCGKRYQHFQELGNRRIFETKEACMAALWNIRSGVVLVKASNANKFGELVDFLKSSTRGF